jgi:tetratricopeptide (TPR) repeat protein
MLGNADEAWRLGLAASQRLDEYGAGRYDPALAELAMYLGQHDRSVAQLRMMWDDLERLEMPPAAFGWVASLLGHSLCLAGQHDEAKGFAEIGREHAPDDVLAQALWRLTLALVHSHRHEHDLAEKLAREGIAVFEPTDLLNWQGIARWDFGEALVAAGRKKDAVAAYEDAIRCFERKGTVAMVRQVRPRLEALRAAAQT